MTSYIQEIADIIDDSYESEYKRGYAAGVARERARCASIAMQQAKEWEAYSTFYGKGRNYSAITIAAAIRAGDEE